MNRLSFSQHWRGIASIACGLGLAAGLTVYKASADEWNRQTVLNVGQTIQIKDTVLEPGKYVLRAMDSPSNRHVVQIFNAEQNHVYATILSIPAERLEPTGDTKLVFWETPAGTARALRLWYYPGRLSGDEFPYPKHPLQLAQAIQPSAPPAPPEPAPEPQAAAESPAPPQQEPALLAQNAPPPPPPTAQSVETPAPPASIDSSAQTLPKTASFYPLYGLSGAIALALFALLRLTFKPAAQES
jgi:hypothetical protein